MNTAKETIRVAVIQTSAAPAQDLKARLHSLESRLETAAENCCDLVVLPETFATGFDLPRARELAAHADYIKGWMNQVSSNFKIGIAGGLYRSSNDRCHSSAILTHPDLGVLLETDREVPFHLERHFLAPGRPGKTVDTPWGRVAMLIGYDLHFPQIARAYFSAGAELLLCPAALMKSTADSISAILHGRTAENCANYVFASATGDNTRAGLSFLGQSTILQPPVVCAPYSSELRSQHSMVKKADRAEQIIWGDLDMTTLRRTREAFPPLSDERSWLNGSLEKSSC